MKAPALVSTRERRLSPWVVLVERTYQIGEGAKPQTFHSFRVADYATVLAVTRDGRVPLVRQFRPALQRVTLELPGGLVAQDEDAATGAIRELAEETGFSASSPPIALAPLSPDTGRLENRLHGYFVRDAEGPAPGWQPEPGVEAVVMTLAELRDAIVSGRLDHALHVAIVAQALVAGLLCFDC